ncbi:MAG: hypothetical protein ACRC8S_07125 [Fimbriiglobus sp.]
MRDQEFASAKVSGPAIGLIVTSAIGLIALFLGLAFDLLLLTTGLGDDLPAQQGGIRKEQQIMGRMTWSLAMVLTNTIIFIGAIHMKRLKSCSIARLACILAVVPCCGPCFVLGIPFGIWGIVTLGDSHVRGAFDD